MLDVNDHRPLSSWPVYWPGVAENSPPDTLVVTVDASDPDPAANITYAITAGNPQSLFTIDAETGMWLVPPRHSWGWYLPAFVPIYPQIRPWDRI